MAHSSSTSILNVVPGEVIVVFINTNETCFLYVNIIKAVRAG